MIFKKEMKFHWKRKWKVDKTDKLTQWIYKSLVWEEKIVGAATIVADSRV